MSPKINILKIIKDHISTIINANDGKVIGVDIFTFLILPISFASIFTYFKIFFVNDFIDMTVSALSIFVGLLFNIIVLLFDVIKKDKHIRKELVKELLANISFCIIISISAILLAFTTKLSECTFFVYVTNFLTYSFLFEFLITLFMILKRMYYMFLDELDS